MISLEKYKAISFIYGVVLVVIPVKYGIHQATNPPRTMGTVPYFMAIIWVKPQGSKVAGHDHHVSPRRRLNGPVPR